MCSCPGTFTAGSPFMVALKICSTTRLLPTVLPDLSIHSTSKWFLTSRVMPCRHPITLMPLPSTPRMYLHQIRAFGGFWACVSRWSSLVDNVVDYYLQ